MADRDAALRRELGEPPDFLSRVEPAAQAALAGLIQRAREAQDHRLQHALKHSLDFIPPFLRGPVRSLFLK